MREGETSQNLFFEFLRSASAARGRCFGLTRGTRLPGVVYCEMLARENTSYNVTEYELQQLMHHDDGYNSETGGRMSNLRDSCTHKKMADYHKEFYRPVARFALLVAVSDFLNANERNQQGKSLSL